MSQTASPKIIVLIFISFEILNIDYLLSKFIVIITSKRNVCRHHANVKQLSLLFTICVYILRITFVSYWIYQKNCYEPCSPAFIKIIFSYTKITVNTLRNTFSNSTRQCTKYLRCDISHYYASEINVNKWSKQRYSMMETNRTTEKTKTHRYKRK